MSDHAVPNAECSDTHTCDRCDTMLAKVSTPGKIKSQKRFLNAYSEKLKIATAARLAGIHRATVYRWMTEPEFVKAMRAVTEEYFRRVRMRVDVAEAERKRWREERERARHPMRCEILAKARAAKLR